MNPNKRRDCSPAALLAKRPRKTCSYADKCYRRNPAHLREFSHPHLESILDNYLGTGEFPIPEDLTLQKDMIEDQLKILLEKEIYSPGMSKQSSVQMDLTKDNASESGSSKYTSLTDTKIASAESVQADLSKQEADTSCNRSDEITVNEINVLKKNTVTENEENVKLKNEAKPIQYPGSFKNTSEPSAKHLAYADYRPIVKPTKRIEDHFKVVAPKGRMAEKHRKASPYYIFYTTITASKVTHNQKNSITFQEILDPSFGELKCSLQINFMVDIGWLLAQYYFAGYCQKRLTVLYGDDNPDLIDIGQKRSNVDTHYVNMGTPFGKHHTKMMLLCYEDGSLRVVVSTANLYNDDWENRTQGLWISPSCPELPAKAMPHEGESPTLFKRSLLQYLDHYRMAYLTQYTERVRRCDFSYINVFLIASAPGGHFDNSWGMLRMGSVLSQNCISVQKENWQIIAQASSIGSFGKNPSLWLTGDFLNNFSRFRNESALENSLHKLKLVFPSLENVQQSHDGLLGGGCLPYSAAVHTKQRWLKEFLHQWKATSSGRDKAMPHIKSYLRASEDYKKASYYLLTSANVSKAAWGVINKGNKALRIMSYEAGVLFLPRFVLNREFFPLDPAEDDCLPLVYDLPVTPYAGSMSPWVQDYLFSS